VLLDPQIELTAPAPSQRPGQRQLERAEAIAASAPDAAAGFTLERRLDGKLWLIESGRAAPVNVVRCFPWSEAGRFLSLRDAEGAERGFVSSLDELDAASRAALEAGLVRSSFVLDIVRVHAIDEDFELRSFVVETAQGPRRFQTPLDGWPRELEDGGLVLEDVQGDLYRVEAPNALDARSRSLLRAFID
jgi:hypothetical protein